MRAVSARITKVLDRFHPSESAVLLVTAVIVGAGTGLGAVIFIKLIGIVQNVIFINGASTLDFLGSGLIILAPMVGGLLAGPIISFFANEAKGHGVPEVMQAIALRGGRIRPRVVVAKVIASALCIGSGGSAGREGPIVQVGSALGSTFGQWLHLPDMRIRNLVACGHFQRAHRRVGFCHGDHTRRTALAGYGQCHYRCSDSQHRGARIPG